jgi:hypothetical protein
LVVNFIVISCFGCLSLSLILSSAFSSMEKVKLL